jgi:gamma-glutamylcyclotransferase (GGCT)/AIG2-like uncharacterized protein YtfP
VEIDRIFVYGTLMRGEARHGALGGRRNLLSIEPASVAGRLVDCGAYPGLLLDAEAGARVTGEVVRVRDVAATLSRLDGIEGYRGPHRPGSLYRRELVVAWSVGGAATPAWTYVLADARNFPSIDGGDWRHRSSRDP